LGSIISLSLTLPVLRAIRSGSSSFRASRRPLVCFLYLPFLNLPLPYLMTSLTESPQQAWGMFGRGIRLPGIIHVIALAIFLSTEEATSRYAIPSLFRQVSHVSFVMTVLPATFAFLPRANAISNVLGTRTAPCVCRKFQAIATMMTIGPPGSLHSRPV